MQTAGVAHLAGRLYPTLSGGEQQGVHMARALVQIWEPPNGRSDGNTDGYSGGSMNGHAGRNANGYPGENASGHAGGSTSRYLLLDEPTTGLDLAHQRDILATVRRFASADIGVLAVLHDLNLAAQHADRIAVLRRGRLLAVGSVEEILLPPIIEKAFDVSVLVTEHPCAACPLVVPVPENAREPEPSFRPIETNAMPASTSDASPTPAFPSPSVASSDPVASSTPSDLRKRWDALLRENPSMRIRNAAGELGVSEAELVATCEGDGTVRLRGDWGALIQEIETLGEVMALTRNVACVHEKKGVYRNVKLYERHRMGAVLDEEIDLRLMLDRWRFGFAVETPAEGMQDGLRRSLQFFDASGIAVHKVFLTRQSNVDAYERLVDKYRQPNPAPPLDVVSKARAPEETPDAEIDPEPFLQAWRTLKDTHDFFPLLKKHRIGRLQALRLAEGEFAHHIEPSSARQALQQAADTGMPIMVFVGSPGCIQIHTGPVNKLKEHGPWYNVLDPRFNLHLREERIAAAWVVSKPTEDGVVTALEFYDAEGGQIVQFFGKRKPGMPEMESWRDIVRSLLPDPDVLLVEDEPEREQPAQVKAYADEADLFRTVSS